MNQRVETAALELAGVLSDRLAPEWTAAFAAEVELILALGDAAIDAGNPRLAIALLYAAHCAIVSSPFDDMERLGDLGPTARAFHVRLLTFADDVPVRCVYTITDADRHAIVALKRAVAASYRIGREL
jgi:hypothetical protein